MTTTSGTSFLGYDLLNTGDFYQGASILHPIVIGSITIVALFCYLRVSSNRTTAPLTIWDKIVNVALGSTLAGIINGNSLTKGILALTVLLLWQFLTSSLTCLFPKAFSILFTKPPVVIAFRGRHLKGVMKRNRITPVDVNGALRKAGIFNICEVECIVVGSHAEPTGDFSIFRSDDLPKDYEPEVLLSIKGYRRLVEHEQEEEKMNRKQSSHDGKPKPKDDAKTKKDRDEIANDAS